MLTVPQLSDASGNSKNTIGSQLVIGSGHVIVGITTSTTIISKEQVAIILSFSTKSNVFWVIPTGNSEPEGNPAD